MRGVAAGLAVAAVVAALASAGPAATPRREIVFASDWAPNLHRTQAFSIGLDGSRRTLLGGLAGLDEIRLSYDRRRLVFLSVDRRSDRWTYRVESAELDGGDRRTLVSEPVPVSDVALSPDGTRLALTRIGGAECSCQNWELLVVDLATGERRKVAEHAWNPRWSPDGTRLLYGDRGTRIRHKRVHLVSADGGAPRDVGFGYAGDWAPDGRTIAFTSVEGGPPSVWVAAGDGSRARRLATGISPSWAPSGRELAIADTGGIKVVGLDGRTRRVARSGSGPLFSPDGRRIAFVVYPASCSGQVVVVAAAGGGRAQLTHEECRSYLAALGWLDGEHVLYGSYLYGNDSDVLVADADALDPQPLAQTPSQELDPAWAPDGGRVAFARVVPGPAYRSEVWTIGADGRGETRVTAPAATTSDSTPAWSPDGRTLVFARGRATSGRSLEQDLYLVGATGGEPRRLTSLVGSESQPSWSPDGRPIAFTHRGPAFEDLPHVLVVAPDGGTPRALLGLPRTAAPSWSPDGSRLAFVGAREPTGAPELYVAGADGSAPLLVVDRAAESRPAWAPNGRSLLYVRSVGVETLHRVSLDGAGDVELTETPPYAVYDSPDWAR